MNAEQIKKAILQHVDYVDCSYDDRDDKRKYYAGIVSLLEKFSAVVRKDQDNITRLACIKAVELVDHVCETPTGNDAYLLDDIITALVNTKLRG